MTRCLGDPDAVLAAWIDEGPTRLPDEIRRAIVVALPTTTRQRRGASVPRRSITMSTAFKAAIGAAAVIAVVLGGNLVLGPSTPEGGVGGQPTVPPPPTSSPTPSPSPSVSPAASPDAQRPFDTVSWRNVVSDRYGFTIGYPADWTMRPSTRAWSDVDATDRLSPAHDDLASADGQIRVSAWAVPLRAGNAIETADDIEAWAVAYCRASGASPCSGLHGRAVPLCIERRDCHPALLVPYDDHIEAYLINGIYPGDAMTVVAIWLGPDDPAAAAYGGTRRLFDGILSTMSVWPASLAFDQRH